MDFADVFKEVAVFFIHMCSVHVTFGGISFTVGALFLWCAIAVVLVGFIRGMKS